MRRQEGSPPVWQGLEVTTPLRRVRGAKATEAPGEEATVAQGEDGVGETEAGGEIEPSPEEMEK